MLCHSGLQGTILGSSSGKAVGKAGGEGLALKEKTHKIGAIAGNFAIAPCLHYETGGETLGSGISAGVPLTSGVSAGSGVAVAEAAAISEA